MKKIFIITFFVSVAVSVSAQQTGTDANKIISQDEFIDVVMQKAPELSIQKLDMESSKIDIKTAVSEDDVSLSAGSEYYNKEYDPTSSQSGLSGTSGVTSYASATKKFSKTGTEVTGLMNYDTSVSEYDSVSDSELYSPSATISVRQPLLNNFFGKVDRYTKKTAETAYEISKLNYTVTEREIEDYYRLLYCQWIVYRKILDYNAENVENAQKIYSQTQRKFNARLAENDDLQDAYSSVLTNRQNYETSRLQLHNIENEIFTILENRNVVPDSAFFDKIYLEASGKEYSKIDFSRTQNYTIMNMTLQKLVFSEEAADNGTLPDFDVIASLTRKDSDEVGSKAWDFDKTEYSVGFEFTYKLGNNAAEAESEKAANTVKSYRETIRQTQMEYDTSIENALKGIETYRKIIDFQERNLAAMRSSLITERKKYSQARITLSTVISTENSIASMRTSLLSSKLKLINYYIDYAALTRQ